MALQQKKNNYPKKIKLNKKVLYKNKIKIKNLLTSIFKELKKNEKNEKDFYGKYLYPESNLSYYLQWKILSKISIKDLIIKTGLDEYIKKNISNKYYIYSMIFLRYHVKSKNINNYLYKNSLHFDNYNNLKTHTFWIPFSDINLLTGGLIFRTKLDKNFKNKFIKIGKFKNQNIYQTKCNFGEAFTFNNSLLHTSNQPKSNYERISIDIRVVDQRNIKEKKLKRFNKNYYNKRGVFRPNKLLSLNKIDKEVKKFKSVIQNSLLGT